MLYEGQKTNNEGQSSGRFSSPRKRMGAYHCFLGDLVSLDCPLHKGKESWRSRGGSISFPLKAAIVNSSISAPCWLLGLVGFAWYLSVLNCHPVTLGEKQREEGSIKQSMARSVLTGFRERVHTKSGCRLFASLGFTRFSVGGCHWNRSRSLGSIQWENLDVRRSIYQQKNGSEFPGRNGIAALARDLWALGNPDRSRLKISSLILEKLLSLAAQLSQLPL